MDGRPIRGGRPLAALALIGALLAFGQAARSQSESAWTKRSGGRFDVYSNASAERARAVLRHLESLEAAYSFVRPMGNAIALEAPEGEAPLARVQVLFFADAASYLPFQVASSAPAFYQFGRGRSVVAAYDLGPDTFNILGHEYFHIYTHRHRMRLPEWLEEGLAEYYSTLRVREGRVVQGVPLSRQLALVTAPAAPPWSASELFRVDEDTVDLMAPGDKQRFYARSYLLAHMLQHHPEWRDGFPRLLTRIQQGESESAFLRVYGREVTELDEALSGYRPSIDASAIAPLPDAAELAAASSQPPANLEPDLVAMPEWELPLLQADVLALLGRQTAAHAAFTRLAERFPEVPQVYEALGQLALEQLDLRGAQGWFEEAVKRNSSSAEVYLRLATLRCGMQSEEANCLDWIDRAVSLGSSSTPDGGGRERILYAIDFALNAGDFQRALRYLTLARPLTADDRFHLLLKTAYARYRLEEFDAARSALTEASDVAVIGGRRKEIADLRRAIEQREQFLIQRRLFGDSEAAHAPYSSDPASSTSLLADALRRTLAAFEKEPNAVLEMGNLREILCDGHRIAILADTPRGRLRLEIENPMDLMVLRNNRRLRELDLTCGAQAGEAVQLGYLPRGSGAETHGLLRILRFEPGRNANE